MRTSDYSQPRHTHRDSTRPTPSLARYVTIALGLSGMLGILALAARGVTPGSSYSSSYVAPSGWHDITPPTGEQVASYAISPDVPGLIVACVGDQTAHTSAAPMGQAHLWRTRDAGAHWSELSSTAFYGGCQVTMPPGGHGAVFAINLLGPQATPPQFIAVSHDAGDTWQTIATASAYPNTLQQVFTLLGTSVYRAGQLYSLAALAPDAAGDTLPGGFFASRDDGRTWTTLDPSADPLTQQDFFATGLAPDQRAPGAWYRLMARGDQYLTNGPGGTQTIAPELPAAVLEHSSDGGKTWSTLGPIGPQGPFGYGQSLMYGGDFSAMLVTSPAQPNRLCAGFYPSLLRTAPGQSAALINTAATSYAPAALSRLAAPHTAPDTLPAAAYGPPYTPPRDLALYSSDDGGATWHGATVFQGGGAAQPIVAMDARGACYTAGTVGPDLPTSDQLSQVIARVWRLAPGTTMPQQIAKITGQAISTLGITTAPGDATPRLLALLFVPQPEIICQGDVCPPETPHPPHLIWRT